MTDFEIAGEIHPGISAPLFLSRITQRVRRDPALKIPGGRGTGRSGANPGAAAGTAVRVRIMRLRATHISGPPPRFKVTLLIVEARTASSCQMKCDYLAQTWTVKHERKMNLTKFFFGVAVGPLYISSKLFPYFAKEKFSLLHFLAAKKFS